MKNNHIIFKSLFFIAYMAMLCSCSMVKMARNANILFPPYAEIQRSFAAQNDSGITRISDTFHSVKLDSNFIASTFDSKLLSKASNWQKKKIAKSLLAIQLSAANKVDSAETSPAKPEKAKMKIIIGSVLLSMFVLFLILHVLGTFAWIAFIIGMYFLISGLSYKEMNDEEKRKRSRRRFYFLLYILTGIVSCILGGIIFLLALLYGLLTVLIIAGVILGLLSILAMVALTIAFLKT